jgi:hypothetical protein
MQRERVVQDSMPLFVFDRSGNRTRTLGPFPGHEYFFRNRIGSLRIHGERLRMAAGGNVVYVGSTGSRVIRALSPTTGQVVRSITLPIEPRRLTRQDMIELGTGLIAEHRQAQTLPDFAPYFSEMRLGADGRLWVKKYRLPRDTSQEWLAFGENGGHEASLTMDASLTLLDVGADFAIVVATDELDVPEVRLHRLTRP